MRISKILYSSSSPRRPYFTWDDRAPSQMLVAVSRTIQLVRYSHHTSNHSFKQLTYHPYAPCMEYLPTFTPFLWASFVGKYSIHGAYGSWIDINHVWIQTIDWYTSYPYHHGCEWYESCMNLLRIITGWWFGTWFFHFFHILGMSSSQLTFIFFRGVGQPPTR